MLLISSTEGTQDQIFLILGLLLTFLPPTEQGEQEKVTLALSSHDKGWV